MKVLTHKGEAFIPLVTVTLVFASARTAIIMENCVMNPNGSVVKRLTVDSQTAPATDLSPAWSPDGSRIAFSRDFDSYSMDADGSNRTQLTNNSDSEYNPTWSPDGSRIAYER